MCSVMAGLTALAGYSQYRGQQEAANAQAASYRAQADAMEQNARVENKRQEQIADNYARQAQQLRQRQRIVAGQQRAQAGSAGLGMGGSALDLLSAGYDAYNQDQQTLLMNQRNDNYNSRVQETNFINQAAGLRSAAGNVKRNARAQGLSTILGTAASIYGLGDWGGTKSSNFKTITTGATGVQPFTATFQNGKLGFTSPNRYKQNPLDFSLKWR